MITGLLYKSPGIKKIGLLIFFCLISFTTECKAMKLLYYDISVASNKEAKYAILPNGIIKIELKELIVFVRPANRVFVAEGQQLWLWGSKKPASDLFFSEFYYPEGSSINSKPNYFCVDVLLYSKNEAIKFNPKKTRLINDRGQRTSVSDYMILDNSLQMPFNYGSGHLFNYTYNHDWFDHAEKLKEDVFIKLPLKKPIGFILIFNDSPPLPGDLFSIDMEGIENSGNQIELPTIHYDSKKTYTFGTQ